MNVAVMEEKDGSISGWVKEQEAEHRKAWAIFTMKLEVRPSRIWIGDQGILIGWEMI